MTGSCSGSGEVRGRDRRSSRAGASAAGPTTLHDIQERDYVVHELLLQSAFAAASSRVVLVWS